MSGDIASRIADFLFDGWGVLLIFLFIIPPVLNLRMKFGARFGRWFMRIWRGSRHHRQRHQYRRMETGFHSHRPDRQKKNKPSDK